MISVDIIKNPTNKPIFGYLAVWLSAFFLFVFLQSGFYLTDPDVYYHVRIAQLIWDEGILKNFPNLPYTIFSQYFTDHHLLYHILISPFTKITDPFVGAKLSQAIFASLTITAFYATARRFKIPFPALFTFALAVTAPFAFRMVLIKVPALSILTLLLAAIFINERKWFKLFWLTFLFVWLYAGFVLIWIIAAVFWFWEGLIWALRYYFRDNWAKYSPTYWLKVKHLGYLLGEVWFSRELLLILLAVIVGVIAGLITNPYFPQSVIFYWEQIVEIGIKNYQKIIGVGNEWYPYPLLDLVAGTSLVWIAIVGATTLAVINFRRLNSETWAMLTLAMLFFFFTLKSRRYVEYFVPFALLWSGLVIRDNFPNLGFDYLKKQLQSLSSGQPVLGVVVIMYFVTVLPYIAYTDIMATKEFTQSYPLQKFSAAGRFLETNAATGDMIFHNDWDDFPILFYHQPKARYIVGLDPTFMYKANPDLYWKWVRITTGEQKDLLYQTIKKDFKANWVFLDAEHQDFETNLNQDPRFELRFKDYESRIYRVY